MPNGKSIKKQQPDYRVYIDEAGDEGFKFLPGEKGSSRWFVLSATVVRHKGTIPIRFIV